jgi:hypothetical protein
VEGKLNYISVVSETSVLLGQIPGQVCNQITKQRAKGLALSRTRSAINQLQFLCFNYERK